MTTTVEPTAVQVVHVDTYRQLEEVKSRRVVAPATSTFFAISSPAEGLGADDDSEDEDVVDLLARDISTVWK